MSSTRLRLSRPGHPPLRKLLQVVRDYPRGRHEGIAMTDQIEQLLRNLIPHAENIALIRAPEAGKTSLVSGLLLKALQTGLMHHRR